LAVDRIRRPGYPRPSNRQRGPVTDGDGQWRRQTKIRAIPSRSRGLTGLTPIF